MRPIMKLTICAITAAAMTAPAVAANYLKIGDVKGKATADKHKNEIEILSWSWGATRKGWDGTIKGRTSAENTTASGGVRVATGDVNADGRADVITSPRDAASGMPTGKPVLSKVEGRQHRPVTITKPLDRGSVTVKGSMSGCTVGAAYPDAVLQTAAARYEFKEVFITSCSMSGMSGGGGGGVPTESISFNYGKIEIDYTPQSKDKSKVDVRGWDPPK